MSIFKELDAIVAKKLPRAKKVCRLVYIDKNNYGYLNMVLPQDFDRFLVYTQNMGNRASPKSGFMGRPGAYWVPAELWDDFRNNYLSEGWQDVTKNLIDRNKVIPKDDLDVNIATSKKASMVIDRLKLSSEGILRGITNLWEVRNPTGTIDEFYGNSIYIFTKKAVSDARKVLKEMLRLKVTDDIEEYIEQINEAIKKLYTILPRALEENKKIGSRYMKYNPEKDLETVKTEAKGIINRETKELENIRTVSEETLAQFKRPVIRDDEDGLDTVIDGVRITIKDPDDSLIELVKTKLGSEAPNLIQCWYVTNEKTKSDYDADMAEAENKEEELLWHGSKNEHWVGIIEQGLRVEMANHGMFGKGIYFAPKAAKSMGYTSREGSRWANGTLKSGFLALYKVRVGKSWYPSNSGDYYLTDLISHSADSLWADKNKVGLHEDEVIIYRNEQCSIYALVEVGI